MPAGFATIPVCGPKGMPPDAPQRMTLEMTERAYSLRVSRWGSETSYRHDDDALHWTGADGSGSVRYADITKVRIYKFRYFGSRASYWRCVLHCADGRKIRLQAAHHVAFRRVEDRSAAYIPFIKQLESRIAAVNPSVITAGSHWVALVDACRGHLAVLVLDLVRLVPLDWARGASAWLTRMIGPLLKGHRVARANLAAAYPEKSPQEIDRILTGMWDNLGRVFAEYAHLDRLWDYEPDRPNSGTMLVDETTQRNFLALRETKKPILFFSAHLANWEVLCWACAAPGRPSGIVYRQTHIDPIDRRLNELRSHSGTALIPANAEALFSIRRILRSGGCFGMLVDEHFSSGVDVTFFGRKCKVTPLLARYARHFDCVIHGAHMARLPDGGFRFDVSGPIEPPRDATGKIDVAATMQMITGIVEGWIREHPEQWLWLQRRWR